MEHRQKGDRLRFSVGEFHAESVAQEVPENGVDESGQVSVTRPAGEPDRLVDRRMMGNGLEEQELIEGEAEDVQDTGRNRIESLGQKKRRW